MLLQTGKSWNIIKVFGVKILVPDIVFPSIGAQGKSGLITTEKREPGDSGVLAEALVGGGDCGDSYGWDYKYSPRPEVLSHFGGGGLLISSG